MPAVFKKKLIAVSLKFLFKVCVVRNVKREVQNIPNISLLICNLKEFRSICSVIYLNSVACCRQNGDISVIGPVALNRACRIIYSEQVPWKQVLEATKLSQYSLAWSRSAS